MNGERERTYQKIREKIHDQYRGNTEKRKNIPEHIHIEDDTYAPTERKKIQMEYIYMTS